MSNIGIEEDVVFKYLSTGALTSDDDADCSVVGGFIEVMRRTWNNPSYRPIRSYRKLAPIIIFIRKILRRFLFKWYADPICAQQTEFNRAALDALTETNEEVLRQNANLDDLNAPIQEQRQYIAGLNEITQQHSKGISDINEAITEQGKRHGQWISDINEAITEQGKRHGQWISELNTKIWQQEQKIAKMERLALQYNERFTTALIKLEQQEDYKQPAYGNPSFSQTGEDMILSAVFFALNIPLSKVSYLDLGANHARILSNTYYFYQQGACGVLVEANPDLIPELRLYRSGDVVLNKCITNKSGEKVMFYIIGNGDGLSTSVKENAEAFIKTNDTLTLDRAVEVETITVSDIMEQYFAQSPVLLNVDIEGNEEDVLRSIDFDRHRPAVIVCEMIPYEMNALKTIGKKNQEIVDIMRENNYCEYAFTGINAIFIDNKRLQGVNDEHCI